MSKVSSYDLCRLGHEFYEEHLRHLMETGRRTRKLVSIDVETGDYEIGIDEGLDALRRLHARHPGVPLCTIGVYYDREAGHFRTRFYGYFPPVKDLLGKATRQVLAAPDRVESYIIAAGPDHRRIGFAGCTVLAEGPLLNAEQVERLREAILLPEAHFNGWCRFRRPPSTPNFAFRMWREDHVLDILVDLLNPGWEFHCGWERYSNWTWFEEATTRLAKELFPQYASSSGAMWRKGAIKALKMQKQATSVTVESET